MPELRQLTDYPVGQWLSAADACDCGAAYEVCLVHVDDTGELADVDIRAAHTPDCESAAQEAGEVAGWSFSDGWVELLGARYPLLGWTANVAPCLACWRLIVGVPLMLMPESGGALHFCVDCAQARGLLAAWVVGGG